MSTSSINNFIRHLRNKDSKSSHSNISPTALTVAYRRTFSDIPYTKDIYQELEKIRIKNNDPDFPDEYKFLQMAPLFEARHKLISRLVLQYGKSQILDIASGLSPRGLELTRDPKYCYVEFDLPDLMSQKKIINRAILKNDPISSRPSYYLEEGNALSLEDLENAARHFKIGQPITVIVEGLLRYFNLSEKIKLVENIKVLLQKFGGVWITPDIIYRRNLTPEFVANNERVSKLTGINLEENKFKSLEDAHNFFDGFGFSIESYDFTEVYSELASPQAINMEPDEVRRVVGPRVVFVMKLK